MLFTEMCLGERGEESPGRMWGVVRSKVQLLALYLKAGAAGHPWPDVALSACCRARHQPLNGAGDGLHLVGRCSDHVGD